MNPIDFKKWIARLYATKDVEVDCDCVQSLLPVYVEAEVHPNGNQPNTLLPHVEQHLFQCPDCYEVYQGLYHLAELEVEGELPSLDEESLLPDAPSLAETETLTPVA